MYVHADGQDVGEVYAFLQGTETLVQVREAHGWNISSH